MPDARRLALLDPDGSLVWAADISSVSNANTKRPLTLTIEARCDMHTWHREQATELICWGPLEKPS